MNTRSMKEEIDDSHLVQMSGTNFPPHREVPESQRAAQADAVLTHEEVIDILDLTFHRFMVHRHVGKHNYLCDHNLCANIILCLRKTCAQI